MRVVNKLIVTENKKRKNMPTETNYGMKREINYSYEEAVEKITSALSATGF